MQTTYLRYLGIFFYAKCRVIILETSFLCFLWDSKKWNRNGNAYREIRALGGVIRWSLRLRATAGRSGAWRWTRRRSQISKVGFTGGTEAPSLFKVLLSSKLGDISIIHFSLVVRFIGGTYWSSFWNGFVVQAGRYLCVSFLNYCECLGSVFQVWGISFELKW